MVRVRDGRERAETEAIGTAKKKKTRRAVHPAVRLVAGAGGRIEVRPVEKESSQPVGTPGLVWEGGRWTVNVRLKAPVKGNIWERFRDWFKEKSSTEQLDLYNILTAWRSDDNGDVNAKANTTQVFRSMMGGPLRQESASKGQMLILSNEAVWKMSDHGGEHLRTAMETARRLGYVRYDPARGWFK